jgi:IS5 family transposase
MKQLSFADVKFSNKPKQTRRERFLLEMEAVVFWAWLEFIKPHFPKTWNGRSPYKLSTILSI